MLIQFTARNWKSFPELTFSAIASKERLHSERVPKLAPYRIRVLPVTAIYGGNAAGKSNFFEALEFMRRFIVDGVKVSAPIGVKPFALDSSSPKLPTSFEIDVLIESKIYRYAFTATKTEVVEESLAEIRPQNETLLFTRKGEEISFHTKEFQTDRLKFVGQGTQKNLLFLTNSVQQKCSEFRSLYDWFAETLVLVAPEARCCEYDMFVNRQYPYQPQNQETLDSFDVGIKQIETVELEWEQTPFSAKDKEQIADTLPEGATIQFSPFLIHKENDCVSIQKMVAVHSSLDNPEQKILFELSDESDGTRRLLNLIPALTLVSNRQKPRVVFIDEIDRSLHHLLTKKLIEAYLSECSPETRSQLFFTTHDALLMDQNILRRDEMQLVDKNDGRSELISVSDFRLRHDKDLLKSYLYGRLGGVPNIRG